MSAATATARPCTHCNGRKFEPTGHVLDLDPCQHCNASGLEPTIGERMSKIAERFPSLRDRPGVRPWNALTFARDAIGRSHGEQLAARFVLAVWAGSSPWPWQPLAALLSSYGAQRRNEAAFECEDDVDLGRDEDDRPLGLAPFDLMEAKATWDDAHVRAFLEWARFDWRFVP